MIFTDEFAIDLGTANTLVYHKKKGLIYNAPSYISQNMDDKSVIALGSEAKEMVGRTHPNIMTSRPLIDGVISEYECVLPMIQTILGQNRNGKYRKKMTISVPTGVSEIEMRSVVDLGHQLGFKSLEIVDEPMVAALGEGIDINAPKGHLIVDIGAGTTDIAVISLGHIVLGKSIKVASDDFDDAIIKLLRETHKVEIGKLTAEKVKIQYTELVKSGETATIDVIGLHTLEGIPKKVQVSTDQISNSLLPVIDVVIEGVHEVLADTAPELTHDIINFGIILTGGGSMIPLVAKKLETATRLNIRLSKSPLNSVGNGLHRKLGGYKVNPKRPPVPSET